MRMRRTGLAAAALALALTAAACGDGGSADESADAPESKGPIVIGAFNFPESEIMANIYAELLAKKGYEPEVKSLGAREIVFPALVEGEIALVPEYLGTFTEFANAEINGTEADPVASSDVEATLEAATDLASQRGLTVLEPAEAQNQNAFAVTADFAAENDLASLSDLAEYDGELVLGGPAECPQRPFCQPGLEETYGITFADFTTFQQFPLIKQALVDGDIQVGLVFSSDAGNSTNNLVVLEDDKGLQTVDNLVPVVKATENSKDIEAAMESLASVLTTEELTILNDRVENQRETPVNVASSWLKDQGLI